MVKECRFRRIDWPYTSTLGSTIVIMVVLMFWATQVPLAKEELRIDELPHQIGYVTIPKSLIQKEDILEEKPGGGAIRSRGKSGTNNVERSPEDRVARRGLLKWLAAKGPGAVKGGLAVDDVFREGSIVDNQGNAFEGIGGVDVALAPEERRPREVDVEVKPVDLEKLGTPGIIPGTGPSPRGKVQFQVKQRVTIEPEDDPDTNRRRQKDILRVVRRRLGGIKHCYDRRLLRNPELAGKVVIEFTIHPGGKVIEVNVLVNTTGDDLLAECIADRIKSIRFPAIQGDETSVTYPFILEPGS
jgi:hypothetical protein